MRDSNLNAALIGTSGSKEIRYTYVNTTSLEFLGFQNWQGSLDNVSVKEIIEVADFIEPVTQGMTLTEAWTVQGTAYTELANTTSTSVRVDATISNTDDGVLNVDPEATTRGVLGVSWTPSSRIAAFFSADITKEETSQNRLFDAEDTNTFEFPNDAEKLTQRYLATVSFMVNDKLSVAPSYTFMLTEQDQEIIWEDGGGDEYLDSSYSNTLKTHNLALSLLYAPTEVLNRKKTKTALA